MTDATPSRATRVGAILLGAVGVALAWSAPDAPLTPAYGPDAGPDAARVLTAAGSDGIAPVPGVIVVDLADDAGEAGLERVERLLGADLSWATEVSADEALATGTVADPAAALAALVGDPQVEAAEPLVAMGVAPDEGWPIPPTASPFVKPATDDGTGPTALPSPPVRLGFPDDPLYARQWNLGAIGAEAGWRVGGGRGVIVAVIDTGVTPTAELPAERVLPGRSLVPGEPSAADGNGHGTHVAGTIAQATNNGVGVAGVAPGAVILPIKVLDRYGSGSNATVAAGIDEAVDQGAQVINLSLGGAHSAVVVNAVEKARKKGVLVVAAAGNTGREGIGSPADAPAALAVSALGPGGELAPYSSWGKGVEIAAPGGDTKVDGGGILQALPGTGDAPRYAAFQGTSMASPHVAGAAAVLIGAGERDPAQVEALLRGAAVAKCDPTRYGSGALDVHAAVRRLLVHQRALLFLAGGLVAAAFTYLGGLRGLARVATLLTGAFVAGGAFFLPLLPLPPSTWAETLARPLLAWPSGWLAGFPLWQSAALPFVFGLLLAPSRTLGPLALGLCAGVGSYLLYGAATGGTGLWWLPPGWGATWLTLNGTVALLVGLAVTGMQRLRRRKAS